MNMTTWLAVAVTGTCVGYGIGLSRGTMSTRLHADAPLIEKAAQAEQSLPLSHGMPSALESTIVPRETRQTSDGHETLVWDLSARSSRGQALRFITSTYVTDTRGNPITPPESQPIMDLPSGPWASVTVVSPASLRDGSYELHVLSAAVESNSSEDEFIADEKSVYFRIEGGQAWPLTAEEWLSIPETFEASAVSYAPDMEVQ